MKIILNADEKDLLVCALLDAGDRLDEIKKQQQTDHRRSNKHLFEREEMKERLLCAVLSMIIDSSDAR